MVSRGLVLLPYGGEGEGDGWHIRRADLGRTCERFTRLPGNLPSGEHNLSLHTPSTDHGLQLHKNQDHPDKPILDHVQELISQLEAAGIKPSPMEEGEEGDGGGDWEEVDSEDEDGDVEMS